MDKFTKEQQVQAVYDLKVGYTLGHADIAMLKSMARQLLASMEQEPVAYMHHSGQVVTRGECCDDKIFAICCKVETPLYATPPAPGAHDRYIFEKWWESQNGTPLDGWDSLRTTDGYCDDGIDGQFDAWNACRVAMLHGAEPVSNSDELPLDYLQGHKDGLDWAAQLAEANHPQTGDWLYDDPIELSKAIRKGPDMPLSDGNSPVIQDGWIKCSERMPEDEQEV